MPPQLLLDFFRTGPLTYWSDLPHAVGDKQLRIITLTFLCGFLHLLYQWTQKGILYTSQKITTSPKNCSSTLPNNLEQHKTTHFEVSIIALYYLAAEMTA